MKDFVVAIQFLTRIPVTTKLSLKEKDMVTATRMYPLVGLLLGLLFTGVYILSGQLFPNQTLIIASMVVISQVILTGGLHLDGLMDSADGLFSYRPKEQILLIMKDSRVGANGVIALFCVLLLKVSLMESLTPNGIYLLVLMPVLSRWMILLVAGRYTHPNPGSKLGHLIIGQINARTKNAGNLIFSLILLGIGLVAYTQNPLWILLIGVLGILSYLLAHSLAQGVCRRIDGITGDILGAILELGELAILFFGIPLMRLLG